MSRLRNVVSPRVSERLARFPDARPLLGWRARNGESCGFAIVQQVNLSRFDLCQGPSRMAFPCPQPDNFLGCLIPEDGDAVSSASNGTDQGEKGAITLIGSRWLLR